MSSDTHQHSPSDREYIEVTPKHTTAQPTRRTMESRTDTTPTVNTGQDTTVNDDVTQLKQTDTALRVEYSVLGYTIVYIDYTAINGVFASRIGTPQTGSTNWVLESEHHPNTIEHTVETRLENTDTPTFVSITTPEH